MQVLQYPADIRARWSAQQEIKKINARAEVNTNSFYGKNGSM